MILNIFQRAVVVDGLADELVRLGDHLKIKVENAFFKRHGKRRGWDGTSSFFSEAKKAFSRGLLPHVLLWLDREKISYTKVTHFSPLPQTILRDNEQGFKRLRQDQKLPISNWLANGGVGTVWFPTGGGKTVMASSLIRSLTRRKLINKTLFLVTGKSILGQTLHEFALQGLDVGSIGDSNMDLDHPVVVGMVQTIFRKSKKFIRPKVLNPDAPMMRKFLAGLDLIIGDEIHHGRSTEVRTVVNFSKNVQFKLGLSGSPFQKYNDSDLQKMKSEDVRVLASMGPMVSRTMTSDLIDLQHLAKPTIFLVPIQLPPSGLKWSESRREFLFDNPTIHSVVGGVVGQAAKAGSFSLVIAGNSLRYAAALTRSIDKHGIPNICLTGRDPTEDRERIRRLVNNNSEQVRSIVATTIYDEGIDIPDVRLVVIASGGLSTIKTIQRVGRGLRKKSSGQNRVTVIDFVFYNNKYLYGHSLERVRQYASEPSFDIRLVGNPEDHSTIIKNTVRNLRFSKMPTEPYFRSLAK